MINTVAILPMPLAGQSEVMLPGARAPGGGEPVDEGEGFLGLLQQLLVTGVLVPAVQQPIPVEPEAPGTLESPTARETGGTAPDASAGPALSLQAVEQPPAFPQAGEFSLPLPSIAPGELLPEQEQQPGAGQTARTTATGAEDERSVETSGRTAALAPMAEPERKVAMTQPAVAAAMFDLLEETEPVRIADVPVVIRGGIERERPLPETLPRDMTRTAVAEGVGENGRQKTGSTKRAGARVAAVAPGVMRDEPKSMPVFTTGAAADEVPKTARPEGPTAAPVVEPSAGIRPEAYRPAVAIEVRQSIPASMQGGPATREPEEAAQENVPPEVKEKEGVQTKAVSVVGPVVTEGEARDNQPGRSLFSHGHTGTAPVRSDGVRVTEWGARLPEAFQTLPQDTARDVVDQVVKGLALKVQGENSEVRIRLEPESLGEVVVNMRMENGRLQAQIDVTQAGVKGVLESNLGQLRQSLSARGIEVQRLDVVFSGGSGARGSEGGHGERQRRHGGRHPLAAEAVEQYQTGRLLGYNTMEMVM